jgi:PAS domain S-box-containing protein
MDTHVIPELLDPVVLLERMDEGFYSIDESWRFLYVNRSAELFWNLPRSAMLGSNMLTLFPNFAGSPSHSAHAEAFRSNGNRELETISTATGAPVHLRIYRTPVGLSVYFQDITGRRRMEKELRRRDEILTLAEQSAGIGIWVADLTAGTVRGTPQFFKLMGLEPSSEPVSRDLPRSVRHPEDRERVTAGFLDAIAKNRDIYEVEYRIVLPTGEVRWIFGRGRVHRDDNGKPVTYSGVDIDVTARKRQDEHLKFVSRELVHRTNNMLAIIQSMIRQTGRNSKSVRDFEDRLALRIRGLGESNALLMREEWRGANLEDLIRTQLAPFIGGESERMRLTGPPVQLSARAVQNLGMAFHELATNATKYGAFSSPAGTVEVSWHLLDHASALRLMWQEKNGPLVKQPKRSGFGRVVVEQMTARSLQADAHTEFAETGLVWSIDIPRTEFDLKAPLQENEKMPEPVSKA